MARAIWNGAISFGLVSIPVKLYSAVSRQNVRFNQIDSVSNTRVKQQRINAHGDVVPYENIVKGYEITKDNYVIVSADDLDAIAPKASRMIDISDFVEEDQIDPVFYDSAYYLVPDELARKSYVLLTRALTDASRVAVASFVMRSKQYLVAIRPIDGVLMMSTMVYADEVVPAADIPTLDELAETEILDAELAMANQLIDSLASDFDPSKYEDTYRQEVLEMLEAKAAGEVRQLEHHADESDAAVVDLLAALEASVEAAKKNRTVETDSKAQSA